MGNLARAMTWATESDHDLADAISPRSRSIYHILANVYLADARINRDLSRLDEILDLARRLTEQTAKLGQVLAHISALLLQTQALALQGQHTQAKEKLIQALTLAEPGKLIRIFPDSSPALLNLLHLLAAEQPGNAFLAAVVAAFEQANRPPSWLADSLTQRELEILGLIAAGLTNKAIEERLVVSRNTVRTHIKNLYSKLSVSSRTQAVRKGKELGLI
jgi:LuxR family maltose regulon positive regulatory protein